MKLTKKQKERIIEILTLHGAMYGVSNEEADYLIHAINGTFSDINPSEEIKRIQQAVSETTNISIELMKTKTRKEAVVMARSYAIYLVVEKVYPIAQISYAKIGEEFGGFDHASVFQAHKRIKQWIEQGDKLTMRIHNAMFGNETKLNKVA